MSTLDTRIRASERYVLVVEDNIADARRLERLLEAGLPEYQSKCVSLIGDAAHMMRDELPIAILTDLQLPDSKARQTVKRLLEYAPIVPIIVLTGSSFEDMGLQSIDDGAEDFLTKDKLEASELGRVLKLAIERRRANLETFQGARQDAVTSLANRSHLELILSGALSRAQRDGIECALGYVDVDDFKQINDEHGHTVGDVVLRTIGRRLQHSFRPTDLCARIGGDEFAFLLQDVDPRMDLSGMIERMLGIVDDPIRVPGGLTLRVTVSVGLALSHVYEQTLSAVELLTQADREMYSAKERGLGYSICTVTNRDRPNGRS